MTIFYNLKGGRLSRGRKIGGCCEAGRSTAPNSRQISGKKDFFRYFTSFSSVFFNLGFAHFFPGFRQNPQISTILSIWVTTNDQ